MSDSVRPQRRQPTRFPHPWGSPGKNTGVGCHFLLQCMKVKSERKSLSRVRLLATPWTVAHQAPASMGFSRQECWSGVPLPSLIQHILWYNWHTTYIVYNIVIYYLYVLWNDYHFNSTYKWDHMWISVPLGSQRCLCPLTWLALSPSPCEPIRPSVQFSSVQSLSRVWLFETPWITAHQASLSITNSQSSLRLMSI